LDITIYGAAFLALAERLNVQFITLDTKLGKNLEASKYYSLIDFPNKKERDALKSEEASEELERERRLDETRLGRKTGRRRQFSN
jgi:hypothetical protein